MIKYHLSVNGPNRELFGVQTENEPYSTFVVAAQEAGLDAVLEKLSSGASTQAAAVGVVQAVFPNAVQTITSPAPEPWGQPPVPPMVPAAAYQQPAQPLAAPAGAPGPAPTCQHGTKLYKTGTSASNGREWKAWFCPAPGNDPTQCAKQWLR